MRQILAVAVIVILGAVAVQAAGAANAKASGPPAFAGTPSTVVVVPAHLIPYAQYLASPGVQTVSAPIGSVTAGGASPLAGAVSPLAIATMCWQVTTRSGLGDVTGHAYIYQQTSWCAVPCNYITSARTYQYYDQGGWYSITGTFGPQWSTGVGPGVYSDTVHGYVFWHWSVPGVPLSDNNGTSRLDTTVDAGGGSHT